jgi:hypothetical protein
VAAPVPGVLQSGIAAMDPGIPTGLPDRLVFMQTHRLTEYHIDKPDNYLYEDRNKVPLGIIGNPV